MQKAGKPVDTNPKRIPIESQAILRECTESQLIFLANLAYSKDFSTFVEITRTMIDKNMSQVFAYPEVEPQKLAVFKANARGQVGSLTSLIYVMKGAEGEIQRRGKIKK